MNERDHECFTVRTYYNASTKANHMPANNHSRSVYNVSRNHDNEDVLGSFTRPVYTLE